MRLLLFLSAILTALSGVGGGLRAERASPVSAVASAATSPVVRAAPAIVAEARALPGLVPAIGRVVAPPAQVAVVAATLLSDRRRE